MADQEVTWRICRKFPAYKISSDRVVKNRSTNMTVPQFVPHKEVFHKVNLVKSGNLVAAFINELFYDAFPEKRSLKL